MLDALQVSPAAMHDRRKLTASGLRVFSRIAERWGLNVKERMTLLGAGSPSTFHKWMKHPDQALAPRDTLERISHVLGIYAALKILLPRDDAAVAWIRKPNSAPLFGGRPALDRMLAGNVSDLYVVRQYLDSVRGGWS